MRVSGPIAAHNYGRQTQNGFGGLNRTPGAADGDIAVMVNMSSDNFPILSTREQSWLKAYKPKLQTPGTQRYAKLYAFEQIGDKMAWFTKTTEDSATFWISNSDRAVIAAKTLYDTGRERTIVELQGKICVFPDCYYYDTAVERAHDYDSVEDVPPSDKFDGSIVRIGAQYKRFWQSGWYDVDKIMPMALSYDGHVSIEDGTYAGAAAEKNTLRLPKAEITAEFNPTVGMAVKITGATNRANNKTAIIREIDNDETCVYLRFYENTFAANEGFTGLLNINIPVMNFVFKYKNRLWGAYGKSVYCSHLGDPLNWYDYDSLADSAWSVDIDEPEITGAFAYNYPLFFTEDKIFTILGDYPAEYAISVTPNTYGCAKGSSRSFAVVKSYLFYHSPYGFCYYYGSMPYLCDDKLGNDYYSNAIGGGKGHKYYVSCDDAEGNPHTFVYDADLNMWHEEENRWREKIEAFSWAGDLYALMGDGLYTMGLPRQKPQVHGDAIGEFNGGNMPSVVQFAPWTANSVNKKQVRSVLIRHDVKGTLLARLFVDGIENESSRATINGEGMTEIVGIPRRCDNWYLRLEGSGEWKVYSIAYDYYEGTAK